MSYQYIIESTLWKLEERLDFSTIATRVILFLKVVDQRVRLIEQSKIILDL